jgi:uncharacterized protein
MKTLHEIESTLAEYKQQLFSQYPIKSLAIFGSYAREEQDEESDIDIMVVLNGRMGIHFIDLADEIEDLVGRKVDLVSKDGIKDKYSRSIKTELIYV